MDTTAHPLPVPAGVRAYLEIRTAAPLGFSPRGDSLLISSNLSGTAQVHRLDLTDGRALPAAAEDLVAITAFGEPVTAGYLPADPAGGADDVLLFATDVGGNERFQLFTAPAAPPDVLAGSSDLEPLVTDPDHIHRPGGVSRDGRLLAYATNRGDGTAFDCWVRDLVTGTERRVYATGGWTSPAGFSPDGRWLAVSELTRRAGDSRMVLVDLGALADDEVADAGHPAVVELAGHPERAASVGAPSWLPDSSAFFFSTDVGREFSGVARGTTDGEWEYVVEPGWDAGCAVDRRGRHLLVVANEDGRSRARLHDPHTCQPVADVPLPGDGVAGAFHFSYDGRWLAYAFSSPSVPGDVWCHDTFAGGLRRLTSSPLGIDPDTFVEPDLVRFEAADGVALPAFVSVPRTGSGPHPVVAVLHGGPESQYRPAFSGLAQYLLAQGFAVVAPNIRGSTGYGRAFQHLDDVGLRADAIGDLAALHDWLGRRPELDAERAALYGGSYGGYLVLAGLVFQPARWAAGVDVVGISNLETFLENTSAWRREFREREYGSLTHDRALLRELSPITYVERLRAPLFIVHGANDPRVPLGEAEQIHDVLAERGVRCDLLVYPDEGHGLAKLVNRIDAYPRVVAFLHDVLGQPPRS